MQKLQLHYCVFVMILLGKNRRDVTKHEVISDVSICDVKLNILSMTEKCIAVYCISSNKRENVL